MKAVVFYESAPDVVAKAPAHMAEHRARWAEFGRVGRDWIEALVTET